ncbi:MFS transporter [Saccharibacillus sp. CPCC 101409]|uniref:MFS transporter n=1 Tax=Saccharibacillus sp. CPCC 101409 TaxID=3058041 RepID=UPI002671AB81|nr:MFS transporter [Saccharibacillus sp. CPCC 101409]MDO3409338.1 MFS transporter [Saccharibacillus sp. CPCC 101409]
MNNRLIGSEPKPKLFSVFACMWAIVFLTEFVKGALLVTVLPVYMHNSLGLSTFTVSLAFSLQYVGDNALRSPAGWLAEHVGLRRTVAAGLLISWAAVAVMAISMTSASLVIACALLGIGTAPIWPVVMSTISMESEASGGAGTKMGIIQIATLAGTGGGPLVANLIVGDSYRIVFWVLLGIMALVTAAALLLPGRMRWSVPKIARRPHAHFSFPKRVRRVVKRRTVRSVYSVRKVFRALTALKLTPLLYPAMFLQTFAIGILTPVITVYVRNELGLTPGQFNVLLIVGGGVAVAGLIPAGRLVDKFGTRWFLHIGFLLAVIALAGFASTRAMPLVWCSVVIAGLGFAMILPAWNTLLAQLVPETERGAIWGVFLTLQGAGTVLGPLAGGWTWDSLGPQAPFWASASSMALLLLIHASMAWSRKVQAA